MTNIIGNLPVTLANGTEADASQVMENLNYIVNQVNANGLALSALAAAMLALPALGSLINVQILTGSGTYTPSANAESAIVFGVATGGAGGGTETTSSSTVSAGSGGGCGSYGAIYIPQGSLTTESVTVSSAATGNSGSFGNTGGSCSFGSLLVLPGGTGGNVGGTGGGTSGSGDIGANAPSPSLAPSSASPAILLFASKGAGGLPGLNLLNPVGGNGASSPLGTGGPGGTAGTGNPGNGYGSGGSGSSRGPSQGASAGFNSAAGVFVVLEFAGN